MPLTPTFQERRRLPVVAPPMKKSIALLLSLTVLALCGAGCHAGAMWNGHGSPTLNGSVSVPLGGGGSSGGPR